MDATSHNRRSVYFGIPCTSAEVSSQEGRERDLTTADFGAVAIPETGPGEFHTARLTPGFHSTRVERAHGEYWLVCSCGFFGGPCVTRALAERDVCAFAEAEHEFARNRALRRRLSESAGR